MLEGEKCDCETVKALILVEVDELVNHLSVVLSIPNYLHKHLIGPKGETITQIMNSFNDHGKIHFDIPKKSFSLAGLDFVTIKCHKEVAHSIQSRIDDLLSGLLFPEGESMKISSLYSNGLESYISLSLKDFKRIGGYHGEKLIDLSRKYRAFVFVEDELPDSVKLRLVGQTKTASENLRQHFFV